VTKPVEAQPVPVDGKEFEKAVRKAVEDQFAVTGWVARPKVKFVIHCPSGQTCLARHLDTMDLIEADLIEDLDTFTRRLFPSEVDPTGMPADELEKAKEQIGESIWASLRDPEKKVKFFRLLNKLLEIAIVRPKVYDDGVELVDDKVVTGTNRKTLSPGEVNASDIDFSDKMTIFGELNKPLEQIKPFRQENTSVASVEPKQGVGGKAK
jgi:hypothetical protein